MMKGEVKALTQLGQLNELVERTARAMETRLHQKHAEGRRGWKKDIDGLMSRFNRAVLNRDYLDAFILAAMLYDFQQRNSQSTTVTDIPHERRRDRE